MWTHVSSRLSSNVCPRPLSRSEIPVKLMHGVVGVGRGGGGSPGGAWTIGFLFVSTCGDGGDGGRSSG